MYTGLTHTHLLIVSLFLLNILVKTIMLLADQQKFQVLRAKTKVLEMILGTLVLISGFSLFFMRGTYNEMWLNVKMVLVFAGIPLGIIAMKKASKPMAILTLLLFLYVFAVGWTKNLALAETHRDEVKFANSIKNVPENGVVLTENNCTLFHGAELEISSLKKNCPSRLPKTTAEHSLALILSLQ